jgi:hypothetical protein
MRLITIQHFEKKISHKQPLNCNLHQTENRKSMIGRKSVCMGALVHYHTNAITGLLFLSVRKQWIVLKKKVYAWPTPENELP